MSCVEIIKENICKVQSESDNAIVSVEKSINRYLDLILDVKKNIDDLTKLTDDLTDLIHSSFGKLDENDFIQFKQQLSTLINRLTGLYRTIRNSKTYTGVKTSVKEFHYSIDNLIEVYTDLDTFKVRLPKDEEFNKLLTEITEL